METKKQRQVNNNLFKEKNRRQRQDNREQQRKKNTWKFKEKCAEEQRYVGNHRNEDLQKAKDKRAKELKMIREKLRGTDLQKVKDKRAKEQQIIRENLRTKDLQQAKKACKRTTDDS